MTGPCLPGKAGIARLGYSIWWGSPVGLRLAAPTRQKNIGSCAAQEILSAISSGGLPVWHALAPAGTFMGGLQIRY